MAKEQKSQERLANLCQGPDPPLSISFSGLSALEETFYYKFLPTERPPRGGVVGC